MSGFVGEQFARPEAVDLLRSIRRNEARLLRPLASQLRAIGVSAAPRWTRALSNAVEVVKSAPDGYRHLRRTPLYSSECEALDELATLALMHSELPLRLSRPTIELESFRRQVDSNADMEWVTYAAHQSTPGAEEQYFAALEASLPGDEA